MTKLQKVIATIVSSIILLGSNFITYKVTETKTIKQVVDNVTDYCYNVGGLIQGSNNLYFACGPVKMNQQEKKIYEENT